MAKCDSDYVERQQRWLKHLEAATASGETLASYAKAQGLTLADVYRWLTARGVWPPMAKCTATPAAFVPVAIARGFESTAQCTVTFPNGVRLAFAGPVDAAQLQTLLASIGALA
jgi:hypothetical protein